MNDLDYFFDLKSETPSVVIIFSSFEATTHFEFRGFMNRNFPTQNAFYLKDSQRSWYYRGIKGFSNSHEGTFEKLQSIIAERRIKTIYTMGMSSGGYASLLYGHFLNANRIFCFSPLILLDGTILSHYMWRLKGIIRDFGTHPFIDLRNLDFSKNEIDIYYDPDYETDALHVTTLISKWKNPNIIYTSGGHLVARKMRDNGELKKILIPYLGR